MVDDAGRFMVLSDRVLKAVGAYLVELGFELVPRLRDWSGSKGERVLVLDAEEPDEHEELLGLFSIDGVAMVRIGAEAMDDDDRRELLGDLAVKLGDDGVGGFLAWVNDALNDRGLSVGDGLQLYEWRSDEGAWEVDGEFYLGKIEFACIAAGVDKV